MEHQPTDESFKDTMPPGTVRIQDLVTNKTILIPTPSSDPNQPLNWSTQRKVLQMAILCVYTTLIFSILTVMPPLWQDITDELGISTEDLSYGYATAYCSLTVAAIFFVPLSINFGRRPIYIVTAVIMLASAVWMGSLKTTRDVIGANLLSGVAGSVNEALFQVTICDLFFVHRRGTMTGIYLLVVVVGTYLAPVAAGYVAVSQGWRWVLWYCVIFMGATLLVMIFALEETKFDLPVFDGQRQDQVSLGEDNATPKEVLEKQLEPVLSSVTSSMEPWIDNSIRQKSYRERHAFYTIGASETPGLRRYFRQLYQPFRILVLFPAVMFSALQYAWSESMLSFLAVTQATLYPEAPYNFSAVGVGNMNIPPAIGAILGSLFGGVFSDYLILVIAKRRKGIYEPEYRLWTFLVPGLSMTAGVFLYGLTIAKGMPWIINAVGAGLVGFGLGGCGDIALTYVQDSYDGIVAPALIGVVFVRNGMATVMTFVIPIWAERMGFFNMFLMLGVFTAIIVLTCVPLTIWGRYLRKRLANLYASVAKDSLSN